MKNNGVNKNLNCRNFMLGNRYIGMVSKGIEKVNFEKVDLRNNRLNDKGGEKV